MPELIYLASLIQKKGFTCKRCGLCCHETDSSGFVMVTPKEVRTIMASTGRTWPEVAEPYPVFLEGPNGCTYTFEWVLHRNHGHCVFLDGSRCSIYPARPWICRTYPFMLDGDELRISECTGLGEAICEADAQVMAVDLIHRQMMEREEEELVMDHIGALRAYHGRCVVIDGEGVKPVDP